MKRKNLSAKEQALKDMKNSNVRTDVLKRSSDLLSIKIPVKRVG